MTLPVPTSSEPARSRRTLLAAAAGGLLAAVAGALGRPVPAAATHLLGFGHVNDAGAANTTLTTSSTGTALLVTQNGTGTALRGSASNGIAGFFTSASGSGVSGVVAANNKFGVYGANDALTYGGGAAIRADGKGNHGLVATTAEPSASAVRGFNMAGGYSVHGEGWIAVYGESASNAGVWGQTETGIGVYGVSGSNFGVLGASSSGVGVRGSSSGDDAVLGRTTAAYKAGIAGANPNALGWAGYFEGNVVITGTLNGSGVLSRIDHPLDPANKTLAHTFVGSPEMKNVYDGTVTLDARGEASVALPAYFEALNTSVHYQLTAIGAAAPDLHVAAKVNKNRFTIAGGQPGTEVSWQVTGVRRDAYAAANPIKVEEAKPAARRGRYLNPLAHGQPESNGWKDLSAPAEVPKRPTRIQPEGGARLTP
jgi:hypothetical protein